MFANKLISHRISKIVSSMTLAATVAMSANVSAQDLLPRDNGVNVEHKAPRWRESEEHPLRILAYALHPIGWLAREAVFRPLSAFAGSTETTRSVMGFREPFDYRESSCISTNIEAPDCRKILPYSGFAGESGHSDEDDSEGGLAARQVFFPDVNFDFNKSSLNNLGKARVKQMASLLNDTPGMNVVVEGHTDYKGSDDYNMKLGEKRAASVIKELTDLGINTERLSPISYGESKPVYTEETDWARAANRRVQFNVKGKGEVSSEVKTELPPAAE